MSYITYSPNEVVYIKGLGYATLVNCGSRNTISQKVQALQPVKKQSIYFDPDLFNSDADSNNSKKSQSKSEDEKNQKKIIEIIPETVIEQGQQSDKVTEVQKKIEVQVINIVNAKIQGAYGKHYNVYTSDKNLSKSVFIIVKSFIPGHKEQIIVQTQISKTIDTLRKQIFLQIGEPLNNYYNIKLFTTSPMLSQLNVHSKTISQCLIKDNDKLILTADFAFGFRPIPAQINLKHKIILNGAILSSSKPVEEAKKIDQKAVIALPPPPVVIQVAQIPQVQLVQQIPQVQQLKQVPQIQQIQQPQQQKMEEIKQIKEEKEVVAVKVQEQKPEIEVVPVVQQQKNMLENGPYQAKCNIQFGSGKKYWEVKVQKLPIDEQDLVIGVCLSSSNKQAIGGWGCDYIWGYQAVSGKKIFIERDLESNIMEEESESYGYVARTNDNIGVLLSFKNKTLSITYYKNSIFCGEAFLIDLTNLKGQNLNFIPFVNIGGEAQVTLDSKAQFPIDSFRFK